MPYNMPLEVFSSTNFVAAFLQVKCTLLAILHFSPFWLRATYAVHLRLIVKPVVDFLLVITDLFSLGAIVQVL